MGQHGTKEEAQDVGMEQEKRRNFVCWFVNETKKGPNAGSRKGPWTSHLGSFNEKFELDK